MDIQFQGRTIALLASLTALLAVHLARAQTADTSPATAAQVKCPVLPDEDIDPEIFTDYEGKRVYFCCERCKKKFGRDPDQYAARLVADQGPAAEQPPQPVASPPEHASHDHLTANEQPEDHQHAASDQHGEHTEQPHAVDAHGSDDHAGHEHLHGGSHTPWFLNWLGNFHPPTTSFPIGVLFAAAVAEALFLRSKAPIFDQAARFGVWFAAITGIATALLGWCFGGFRLVDHDPILLTHRWLGTASAIWMLALLWACERSHRLTPPGTPAGARRGRRVYLFMLFGGAALVLATGFFGGAMVYGLSHYWS